MNTFGYPPNIPLAFQNPDFFFSSYHSSTLLSFKHILQILHLLPTRTPLLWLFLTSCLGKIHLLVPSLAGLCMVNVSLQVVHLLTFQVCSMGAFHGSSSLTNPSYNLLFPLPFEARVFLLQHIWNSGVLCLDSVACFSHLNAIFIDTQYLSDHSLWYLLCLELCLAHVIDL